MPPLVIENACKRFRQGDRVVEALAGVSLAVERGTFLAIMGASGSGKSTLLHLMAGLTQADAGKVIVDGQDLSAMNDHDLTLFRRHHIGLVFQAFNLIPSLTAEENVRLPLMLDGQDDQQALGQVEQIITRLGLSGRAHHRPDALSGGEQQRVAIGRALITNPAVILADEPTGNLDSTNSRAVCELLQKLCTDSGRTIVMVTHEPSVAAYAKEVAILKDGKVMTRFETGGIGGEQLAFKYQESIR